MFSLLIPYLLSAVFTFESSFPIVAQKFEMDEIGNYYFINGQVIEKRDSKGNLLFRNSLSKYPLYHFVIIFFPIIEKIC